MLKKCLLCGSRIEPKSNRQAYCEKCSKAKIREYDRKRKEEKKIVHIILEEKRNEHAELVRKLFPEDYEEVDILKTVSEINEGTEPKEDEDKEA